MLMHGKSENRSSFGFNAKEAYSIGSCFRHYRTFRGLLPLTGGKRLSDSVKFKHHAIVIPNLTPENRILEATRQFDSTIKQQPKQAPMDETIVIEILRDVLTGENTERVPLNTYIASTKSKTKAEIPDQGKPCLCQAATAHAGTIPKTTAHLCVSDSEDEDDGEADEATVK